MKKIFSILTAAVAIAIAAVSCQKTPDAAALEISAYTIAESATFGEAVDFTVTAAEATNVTAALIKDGKQLSSVTIREAQAGVFAGSFTVPYTKNMAGGEYDVMFMAMGSGSDRAEKTVKIGLTHPEFASVAFVAGADKYELTAAENVWSYTGALPATLAGYFEAKTAAGTVCNFGGKNVDNVEFGSTSAIALYSYESAIPEGTISFDVVSFQIKYPLEALYVSVPETTDAAYPGTIEVDFKKGQVVAFVGLGDLWVDVDFFDNNGDGTYTFRAEGGKYRLTNQSDWGSLRTERLSDNGDLGTFGWDDAGNITVNEAIWCLGNYNFGKPDMRATRDGRVWSDWETFDGYCMAKIDDYKYQITLRVYNLSQYKFFCTKLNWGDIYGTQYDMNKSNLNGCTNIYANALVGNGNFQQGMSQTDPNAIVYPEEGIVIRFTFDVTNPQAIVVLAENVTDQNLM
jgi:hypothetical protein